LPLGNQFMPLLLGHRMVTFLVDIANSVSEFYRS
jgi:hypothetical protein